MTSRAAGRHRRHLSAQRPQSLLLLEYSAGEGPRGVYLSSGIVPNGSRLVRDRRAFAVALSAALAGVTAAAAFGIIAPLHSTSMAGGQHGTAGGRPPQASAPWSAAPQGSPSGQATVRNPAGPATPSGRPRRTGAARRSTRPPGQVPTPRTGPTASTGQGTSTGTAASTRTRTSAAARSSSGTARPESKVVVRYLVDGQSFGEFQGQVQVVNDGMQPIANWQIVIALPDDTVTAIQNAGGLVSHGILLLQPADVAEVVPPGGTLNVFFVAQGAETTPAACAFNGIACG